MFHKLFSLFFGAGFKNINEYIALLSQKVISSNCLLLKLLLLAVAQL